MAEYAGAGTTALGIIGTTLGGIAVAGGSLLNNGILGNGTGENARVSRYELGIVQENAILKAQTDVDKKIVETFNALNEKIQGFKDSQYAVNMQQAVYNGTNNAAVAVLQNQVAALQGMTKMVIPADNVCPEPMPRYNSWATPTGNS